MRAFIGSKGFDSKVVDDDGELLADGLSEAKALLFAASEDLLIAVKRYFAATNVDDVHHALVAIEEAIAKAEQS